MTSDILTINRLALVVPFLFFLWKKENQGIKIACLEEIAYGMGFVSKEDLLEQASKFKSNEYYNYIKEFLGNK